MERLTFGAAGLFAAAIIGLWIAAIAGYVMNIIKLLSVAFNHFTGNEVEVVLRGVGAVFIPLGAVAGWF